MNPETTPVIVGVGESIDRTSDLNAALEPVALMEQALRAAAEDSGADLLPRIESLDLVGLVTWRYVDPVSLVCERLRIRPARKINASMGGETPVRLVHEAALRIARGEIRIAAIVGGEAMSSMNHARKAGVRLDWTPLASKQDAVRFANAAIEVSPIAKLLGMRQPAQLYPLYEMAAEAAWGQTPDRGWEESANLWAQFAAVAARNPNAWIKTGPGAADIATVSAENRMVSWPYPKLMVANPTVNQGAAVIVASLAAARAAGVADSQMIYIWGGAAAAEADDFLKRDRYDSSAAQTATLARAVEIAGGDARRFDKLELYSCFPIVPKMALRCLHLDAARHTPTVTGGLTFFGGPLNNYMSHATAAMVRALRRSPGELGLLYGQGGIVTKHHALVVSALAPPTPLPGTYSVQAEADRIHGPVPELAEQHEGAASIETYTVLYGRDGTPIEGIAVLRTASGARTMARVPRDDAASLAALTSRGESAVGSAGHVRSDTFGKPVWTAGERRERRGLPQHFAIALREGPLTIITINRPDAMNALHPAANAELADLFDDFCEDPGQWVAIITGAGERAFSAGNDLKYTAAAMARGEMTEVPLTGFAGLTSRFDRIKPVIAAVNGVAMGGGFEIALACDLIIASETASFALPEPKVGLAALAGGVHRLPRQIGLKQAMGILLTGRRVSAAEGLQLGFVNEVAAPGDLLPAARRWAELILQCSPMSIRATAELVQRGLAAPTLEAACRDQANHPAVRALFRSADFIEGPRAFAQKRPPKWQGT
jgi:acetyl-CoA C-acetyltransferase